MDPAEAFLKCFHGNPNFITPYIIEYGTLRDGLVYELSSGEGFDAGTTIYGVTVINDDGTRPDQDPSTGGFQSLGEAYTYIEELRYRGVNDG